MDVCKNSAYKNSEKYRLVTVFVAQMIVYDNETCIIRPTSLYKIYILRLSHNDINHRKYFILERFDLYMLCVF